MEYEYSLEHRKFNVISKIALLEDIEILAAIELLLGKLEVEEFDYQIDDECDDSLSDEMKVLLDSRMEKYRETPEEAKSWDEVEQRLMNKHGYEV